MPPESGVCNHPGAGGELIPAPGIRSANRILLFLEPLRDVALPLHRRETTAVIEPIGLK